MSRQMMSDESHPRTLYVGNLDASVSEDDLCALFSQIGPVKGCRIFRVSGKDPHAFLEFTNNQGAATALAEMNNRLFLDKQMEVNWLISPFNQPIQDANNHYPIYVGDLSPEIGIQTLREAFAPFGEISNCRIVRDPQTLVSKGYAFVSFVKEAEAKSAITAMNGQWLGSRPIRTNWSTRKPPLPRYEFLGHLQGAATACNQPVQDANNHYPIFVGDLSPEVEIQMLREAFAPFGEISNCRIVRDPQTLKSKGYAFVSFVKKAEAESAITAMNGQWLGSRSIRTNWSTRKPPPPRSERPHHGNGKAPTFDEVYNQSSPTNCTVYCGGFTNGITEELMQQTFSPFGTIRDIRVFKDKGYAFIRFSTKEAATHAIEAIYNTEINGQEVKCFWGKETGDPNSLRTRRLALAARITELWRETSE